MEGKSDENNFIPLASSKTEDSESNKDSKKIFFQNTEVFIACNDSQWEETSSMNARGRLAKQNVFYENRGPTSYSKWNANSERFFECFAAIYRQNNFRSHNKLYRNRSTSCFKI